MRLFQIAIRDLRLAIQTGDFTAGRIETLHQLPQTPPFVAGLSHAPGKTALCYDLAYGLGCEAVTENTGLQSLASTKGADWCFCFAGEIGETELSDDAIRRLPAYASTEIIQRCALHPDGPLPIIELEKLAQALARAPESFQAAAPACLLPASPPARGDELVLVESDTTLYALRHPLREDRPADEIDICRLPQQPPFVQGVCVYQNALIPVFDFESRLKNPQPRTASDRILFFQIGKEYAGLKVGCFLSARETDEKEFRRLPPLAQSSWMRTAYEYGGKLAAVIDLGALFSSTDDDEENQKLRREYRPASTFSSRFKNDDVPLFEFSLFGLRLAVPRMEVGDVIAYHEPEVLPHLPGLCAGLLRHQGELIPVLDVLRYFGKRSAADGSWRLFLAQNGDFKAFVPAEKILGERTLPVALHRDLPVVLPHPILYGCYPLEETVVLILNVLQMALHFDPRGQKAFFSVLFGDLPEVLTRSGETAVAWEGPGEKASGDAKAGDQTAEKKQARGSAVFEENPETVPADRKTGEEERATIRDRDKLLSFSGEVFPGPVKKRKRLVPLAVTLVLILAVGSVVLLFTGDHRPAANVAVENTPESSPPETTASPEQSEGAAERTKPELKQDEVGEYFIYTVKPGDTLAKISRIYTGTGFNYPLIAEENGIINPDLIFPRQRIRIYVKLKKPSSVPPVNRVIRPP